MEKIYRVKLNKNGSPNFSTAEEVVYCKDCRHWVGEQAAFEGKNYNKCYSFSGFYTAADDFCSYGERSRQ